MNPYETNQTSWRDEFEKSYVEWVDIELIFALLNSMECSIRFLCETINDSTRWPSKINKSLKTVRYPRIRDAADFLGIPPWLLFNHKEKNSKIRELFENHNSILKPIELPYFSEYEKHFGYDDFLFELSKRVSEKDYEVLSSKLKELPNFRNYNDVIAGNWKSVFSYLNDIHMNFSGGAKFTYRGLENIFRGNLRVNFTPHPREFQRIKSGWLTIEIERSDNKTSNDYSTFLSTVISDMEFIFDQPPWQFIVETPDKQIRLLTWHTLRKNDQQLDTVRELMNRKLPDANFAMNIKDGLLQNLSGDSSAKPINIFDELIQIFKEDVPTTTIRHQKKRRADTLNILFEKKLLQNGDHIIFIPRTQSGNDNDPLYTATLIQEDKKNRVQWHFNNTIYSISSLTMIILNTFEGKNRHHINGNKFWRVKNTPYSLYRLAENIVSSQKRDS